MKRAKYRAVVIGSGKIGALFEAEKLRPKPASHAGALRAHSQIELVALVDTDAANLSRAQELFPAVAVYDSAEKCLSHEKPDIVVIATPPSARLDLVKMCIKNGAHMIVCEKPLAESLRDAQKIKKLVSVSKTVFVLNYQRRFSKLFATIRRDIVAGKFGRIQQVSCYYSNGLYNNGGHVIDALLFLLSDEIVSVIGLTNGYNSTHHTGDSNIDAVLETKGGTRITLQSLDNAKYGIHDIHVFGETGDVLISNYGQSAVKRSARASVFAGVNQLDSKTARIATESLSATSGALVQVIECYKNKTAPLSGMENGVKVMELLEAIKKSAQSGGKKILL
jgi:predicted dehydrogenase